MPMDASLKVAFAAERPTASLPMGETRPPVTVALLVPSKVLSLAVAPITSRTALLMLALTEAEEDASL